MIVFTNFVLIQSFYSFPIVSTFVLCTAYGILHLLYLCFSENYNHGTYVSGTINAEIHGKMIKQLPEYYFPFNWVAATIT